MGKYKGLIFDLDGTLLDSIGDICYSLSKALVSNGLCEVNRDNVLTFIGDGVDNLITRAIAFCGGDESLFLPVKKEYSQIYSENSMMTTAP